MDDSAWQRLEPARPQQLGDQVYESLAQLICSGELRDGERLASEEELCRRFQVSRPVVRRALGRLRADGLIISRKGSGSYVSLGSIGKDRQQAAIANLQGMLYALEFRRTLEPDAARLAAVRRGSRELRRLEEALEAFRAEPSAQLRPRIDLAFHRAIAAASLNDRYVHALDLIGYDIDTGIVLAERLDQIGLSERRRAIYGEHEAIGAAIRRQDPEGAAAAMLRHLEFSQARVIARAQTMGGVSTDH